MCTTDSNLTVLYEGYYGVQEKGKQSESPPLYVADAACIQL